jgi:hypothetical protein
VQAGGAGSSPAPVASLTEYVLSVVNRVLNEHEARRHSVSHFEPIPNCGKGQLCNFVR